ncbi:MAG: protein phosphatase 2C domain-containing protein [Deltaproteobacteria bacterium]|nr:protein phosphatase 2C domain-containing protein [Deltaproteobacteria bacterium]
MDLFSNNKDINVAIAAGGVAGRAHRRAGGGSQDAFAWVTAGRVTAAAVADGCSAGAGSALGAGVGARLGAAHAARRAAAGEELAELPRSVVADVVAELARLARACALDDDGASRLVADALLATLHVCVVRGGEWCAFGVGDGVVLVDDELVVLDEGDAPDYPAYALFPSLPAPRVRVHHCGAVRRGIVLGTDGCKELLARQHETLPNGTAVGGLADQLADERWAKNPSLLHKRLFAWAEHAGAPGDDCTLVVLRRSA